MFYPFVIRGARCISVIKFPFMVRWVVGSIFHGGLIELFVIRGARCISVIKFPFMVRWVVGSIFHGGLIELFLIPASDP